MARRSSTREFKLEAIRVVTDHGVSVAQPARDLDLHENTLRRWLKEYRDDPAHAFPGAGRMKPEQDEPVRLRREVRKLNAERDILRKASASFAKELK